MKKIVFSALVICSFLGCKSTSNVQLNFLDEYVLKDAIKFKNTTIGGLSGLDYVNNQYYFVVDESKNPRVLSGDILIADNQIKGVYFNDVILLNDSISDFYKNNILDLESIFVDKKTGEINLTSEGSINYGKKPSIFKIDKKGAFLGSFTLPKNLSNLKTIKHNAVFEGSSKSVDKKGFWVGMEEPMSSDGVVATFTKTSSPIRITYFDNKTEKATKQFAYQLEKITKPAKGDVNLNGVSAILEYQKNHFFIIERTYQNGYGAYGNVIRVFDATIDKNTTDILAIDSLKTTKFTPLKKRLVFDFDDVRSQLTAGIVDNIEGITLGPKLPNGNQSLILISDDNFQLYGKQLNQFILLEISRK